MAELANLTIRVDGMSCAGCEATITRALRDIPGIDAVRVNVMGGKVNVSHDPARVRPLEVVEAIRGTGYVPVDDEVSFTIQGMSCAGCVSKIEKAVRAIPGVIDVKVALTAGIAKVRHYPGTVSMQAIKDAIADLGYTAEERSAEAGSYDREREAREQEIRRQGINNLIAWPLAAVVMASLMQPMWIFPNFLPDWLHSPWIMFAATTPIVLGPGRQFFVHSWNGLLRGVADMNLLYGIGIGAAYAIAVVNTFFPRTERYTLWHATRFPHAHAQFEVSLISAAAYNYGVTFCPTWFGTPWTSRSRSPDVLRTSRPLDFDRFRVSFEWCHIATESAQPR